jgi:hypothetical protein
MKSPTEKNPVIKDAPTILPKCFIVINLIGKRILSEVFLKCAKF